jgi:multicomponent K+:H+ antiporter subunit E
MFKSILNKVFPHPVLSLMLWFIWLLLNNTVAAGHMLLGFIFAILVPLFTASFRPDKVCIRAPLTLLKYLATVMWDIVVANLIIAKLVLGRNDKLMPAFFRIELDIQTPLGISFLANTISLTPGTVSCDLTKDSRYLLVHALHTENPSEIIKQIKQRYEAPLMKVFTSC